MIRAYKKPPLTFEDQLKKLVSRGLIVNNKKEALSQLQHISYYRLSAYTYPFRQRNQDGAVLSQFKDNVNFSEIITLYEFDRILRLVILDAIERIEIHIRTSITHHFAHKYGSFGHIYSNHFHPNFNHAYWLKQITEEAERSKDEFVRHFKENYAGFPILPIWMTTELMSFGALSFCYTGLKHEDKKTIAEPLKIHHKKLSEWLHTLTYVRNICSHHSRLWNRKLAVRPEEKGSIKDWLPPITPKNDRLFYVLLMLKYLLEQAGFNKNWANKCNELIHPIAKCSEYRISMGFPEEWMNHPIWSS